ncbi:hypothetical protein HOP61_20575 [Halomonas daqingensis]|uniref:Type 4 fimbrial biogenesis protein PilX N-terminal domain-containing protein n=1 Tax=Billgrantia desiderata TaxID=52021 RepID=A0AAW4YY18_9GAMM|nr:PilX N-terminal domain-containing pilus assembly protein [Halomonas desiderata]MCE8053692.1 hypothetical protein [Halomonas desiderata]
MKKQRGAALVVVLSLLAMSLMLGISGMQSSQIDERLAGNYRSASIAQMGAEQGGAHAWGYLRNNKWDEFNGVMGDAVDFFDQEELPSGFNEKLSSDPWSAIGDLENHFGGEGECADIYSCYRYKYVRLRSGDVAGVPAGLYIVSVGVHGASEDIVSLPVFIDISAGMVPLSDLMPITVASRIYNFKAGSSNSFTVERYGDDNFGPAIAVSTAADVDIVKQSIEGNPDRSGNYVPGQRDESNQYVVEKNDFPIFSNAQDLQVFVERVKSLGVDDSLGTVDNPKITYVNGDYDIKDGGGGAGILIVDGDFTWSGNNNYEGLIIVLGQSFTYNGGGGGQVRGAFLHASISDTSAERWEFGIADAQTGSDLSFQGGGNSAFLHDINVLNRAAGLLPSSVTSGLIDSKEMKLLEKPMISSWR